MSFFKKSLIFCCLVCLHQSFLTHTTTLDNIKNSVKIIKLRTQILQKAVKEKVQTFTKDEIAKIASEIIADDAQLDKLAKKKNVIQKTKAEIKEEAKEAAKVKQLQDILKQVQDKKNKAAGNVTTKNSAKDIEDMVTAVQNLKVAEQTVVDTDSDAVKSLKKQINQEANTITEKHTELVAAHQKAKTALDAAQKKLDEINKRLETAKDKKTQAEAKGTSSQKVAELLAAIAAETEVKVSAASDVQAVQNKYNQVVPAINKIRTELTKLQQNKKKAEEEEEEAANVKKLQDIFNQVQAKKSEAEVKNVTTGKSAEDIQKLVDDVNTLKNEAGDLKGNVVSINPKNDKGLKEKIKAAVQDIGQIHTNLIAAHEKAVVDEKEAAEKKKKEEETNKITNKLFTYAESLGLKPEKVTLINGESDLRLYILPNDLLNVGLVKTQSDLTTHQWTVSKNEIDKAFPLVCNEKDLKDYAENKEYGYKTANLKQLELLAKTIKPLIEMLRWTGKKPYQIDVPGFVGVPSTKVLNFLKDKCSFNLKDFWDTNFLKIFQTYKKDNKDNIDWNAFGDALRKDTAPISFYHTVLFPLGGRQNKIDDVPYSQYKEYEKNPTQVYGAFQKFKPVPVDKSFNTIFSLDKVEGERSIDDLIALAQGYISAEDKTLQEELRTQLKVGTDSEARSKLSGYYGDLYKQSNQPPDPTDQTQDPNYRKYLKNKVAGFKDLSDEHLKALLAPHKFRNYVCNLIIRSTGREDTKESANAGGNESVLNVDPANPGEIMDAVAIVVDSYFNEKSFMQRLGAKDLNLFSDAFTPVLFQVMIGEQLSSNGNYLTTLSDTQLQKEAKKTERLSPLMIDLLKIPACGVIYSEEREGGLSKDRKADGSAENMDGNKEATTRITVINASFGLNEGVVNSKVPVDTYFVDDYGHSQSVIRHKDKRLVPATDKDGNPAKGSDEILNPQPLMDRPVLDDSAIFTLKFIADAVEKYYKQPMDIEFVMDRYEGKIYLVQARPLQSVKKGENPSFLNGIEQYKDKMANGEILLVGDGALKFIKSKEQIIIEKNITAALDKYNAEQDEDNKKAVKCVIIGQPAPLTSHEAATFRGYGKPVLVVQNDFEKVNGWIESGTKVVVDLQQEAVVKWEKAELTKDKDYLEGWVSYPIPLAVSLRETPETKKITEKALKEKYKKLQEEASTAKITYKNKTNTLEPKNIPNPKDLLKEIRTKVAAYKPELSTEITKALVTIEVQLLGELYGLVKQYTAKAGGALDKNLKKQIDLLQKYLFFYADKIKKELKNLNEAKMEVETKRAKQRLLYAVRVLQALIYQQPKEEIVDGYSFASLFTTMQSEMKALKELGAGEAAKIKTAITAEAGKKPGDEVTEVESWPMQELQYARLAEYTTSGEVGNKWITFIKNLNSSDNRTKFTEMYKTLNKLGMLQAWMHTSFIKKNQDIDKLSQEFEDAKDYLGKIADRKKELDELSIEDWNFPDKFKAQMEKLTTLVAYVCEDENKVINSFISAFDHLGKDDPYNYGKKIPTPETDNLQKMAALTFITQLVDTLDTSIKTLKGSNEGEYKDKVESKVRDEGQMLQQYFRLLDKMFNITMVKIGLPKRDIWENENEDKLGKASTFKADLDKIEDQLIASSDFNVSAQCLGSVADAGFAGGEIKTLEDFFTFIHQSLLNIIGFIGNKTQLTDIPKNELLKAAYEAIEPTLKSFKKVVGISFGYSGENISLVGISFAGNTLSYKWNYTFGQHSGTIELQYNLSKKDCYIGASYFGQNEFGRFWKSADLIQAFSKASDLKDLQLVPMDKSVSFKWHLPADVLTKNPKALAYIPYYIYYSAAINAANSTQEQAESRTNDMYKQLFGLGDGGNKKPFVDSTGVDDSTTRIKLINEIVELSKNGQSTNYGFSYVVKYLKELIIGGNGKSSIITVLQLKTDLCKGIIDVIKKLITNDDFRAKSDLFIFRRLYSPTFGLGKGVGSNYYKLEERLFKDERPNLSADSSGIKAYDDIKDDINKNIIEIRSLSVIEPLNYLLTFLKDNPDAVSDEVWKEVAKLIVSPVFDAWKQGIGLLAVTLVNASDWESKIESVKTSQKFNDNVDVAKKELEDELPQEDKLFGKLTALATGIIKAKFVENFIAMIDLVDKATQQTIESLKKAKKAELETRFKNALGEEVAAANLVAATFYGSLLIKLNVFPDSYLVLFLLRALPGYLSPKFLGTDPIFTYVKALVEANKNNFSEIYKKDFKVKLPKSAKMNPLLKDIF